MSKWTRAWSACSPWQRGIYLLLVPAGLAAWAQRGLGLGEYLFVLALVGRDVWRHWKERA